MRNKSIYILWEANKPAITIQDLAKIFNLTTSQIYRVLKKYEDKNNS